MQMEPWTLPLLTLLVNVALSPLILMWVNRRKDKREERTTEAAVYHTLIETLQKQIEVGVRRASELQTSLVALQTERDLLIEREHLRRKEDLSLIDEKDREIAHLKAAYIQAIDKIKHVQRDFDHLAAASERSRSSGVTALQRAERLAVEMDRIIKENKLSREEEEEEGL
jgi:hypothetical protein